MRVTVIKQGKLLTEERPRPVPGAGQVLVRNLACGICGSDLHIFNTLQSMGEAAPEVILGHEYCSEIVDFGPETTQQLKIGQRVCSIPFMATEQGQDLIGASPTAPGAYSEYMLLSEPWFGRRQLSIYHIKRSGKSRQDIDRPLAQWRCHQASISVVESLEDLAMKDMPIRIMQFEFDAEELRKNIPDGALNLGLSMTLPYLEPYLIRTMREALKHTTDEEVAAEVKQFIGQEAQHFRQHRKLNDLLRNCYPGLAGLQEIEDQMEADLQRFTRTRSLKFNLAYAEGFEAAICATARTALETTDINAPMTDLSRLFIWHLTEEIEHRTVAFNVYEHLFGDYFYRVIAGIYGQYHFFKYVFKFARFIAKHSPPKAADAGSSELKALGSYSLLFLSLGKWLGTYMPWYNPARIVLPNKHAEFARIYSDLALETRA